MRILILANMDVGLYKFRKELIEELIALGHEIYISLPSGQLISLLEKMGCNYIETNFSRRGINIFDDFNLLKRYKNIIKSVNPDLVITYTIKPNIYGGLAARYSHVRYATNITGLGSAFENKGALRRLVVVLYKFALRDAKVVFFENECNRDVLVSYHCCNLNRTTVLNGAGVNTDVYNYQPYPQNDTVKFLFIGRLMKEKGIEELFTAMRRLIAEGTKCSLDVVGPYEEDYRDMVSLYEQEGWLKYHGYQDDVKPYISACDCFVLPSYHEGMANTNLESASMGRPIITSDIPGCRESVVDGKSGFLCKPADSASLYCAMKKVVNSNNRSEMGQYGREHMIKNFNKSKIVNDTIRYLL